MSGISLAFGTALLLTPVMSSSVHAGDCSEEAAGVWTCSGVASDDDTTITPIPATDGSLTVTTKGDFGLETISGDGLVLKNSNSATGDINFTDENASDITGYRDGILARNRGSGTVSITSTGTVTGTSSSGVRAAQYVGGGLTVDVVDVSGGKDGIRAVNESYGALSITSTGTVTGAGTGATDAGIYAAQSAASDLTVNTVDVTGGTHGIRARSSGRGAVSITSTGTVTATTATNNIRKSAGISAVVSRPTGTTLTLNAMDVTGAEDGIRALNDGTGAVSITSTGKVSGTSHHGIYAFQSAGSGLTVDVVNVTGGTDGIRAQNGRELFKGNGTVSITSTGTVMGTDDSGIHAVQYADSDLTIHARDVTGGNTGIVVNSHDNGLMSVVTTGDVAGSRENGIRITAPGDAAADVSGNVTGGNGTAILMDEVSGVASLVLRDDWSLSGQALTDDTDTDDRLVLADTTLDLGMIGDTADPNAIIGFDHLITNGTDITTLTGTQTAGNFHSGLVESGTLRLDNATLAMLNSKTTLNIRQGATLAVNGTSLLEGSLDNRGTVSMVNGTAGDVLTVSGDYAAGSDLLMEAVLEGDDSASDLLAIDGGTSGITDVSVTNLGGVGAQTIVGIPLVTVGGTSTGEFLLVDGDYVTDGGKQALIAGAYGYTLDRTDSGNWYLTSAMSEPDEPIVDPVEPDDPIVDPVEPDEPVVDPTEPDDPVVDPVEPDEPVVDPTEPDEPVVDPVEPDEPVVDPVEPDEPVVDPAEPDEPVVDPVEPNEPVVDPTEPDEPVVEPEEPVIPLDPTSPRRLQPAVPIALAYPQNLMALNQLPSLRTRVGQRHAELLSTMGDGEVDSRGWIRVEGGRRRFDDSTADASIRNNTGKLHFGMDIARDSGEWFDQVFGVNAYVGRSTSDIDSTFGDGRIETDGYGLGTTGTWYFDEATYLDLQGQYSVFRSDLHSRQLGDLVDSNDGDGYALSIESGRVFAVGKEGWTLTPQAQLVWSSVDFDSFNVIGGRVEAADIDSLRLRIGASLDREFKADTGTAAFYTETNLYQELMDEPGIRLGGSEFVSNADSSMAELVVGGEYQAANSNIALYGEVRLGTGIEDFGDHLNPNANIGIKIRW
ncbi:hypothetical protein HCU01_00080 [Halomonas cupida]|uniref:Autotransporter domain-containing protein n=1 Tax=Halomonas cupida TaxID=44933 RepID=A0ABQ0W8H9_9GAMM|nr:autotransporter outer membrane beta-barrel domain-containing protein [Halomonas cupida]GEN22059.1 hypothetical protein HCU01_00080 [Halomonas cupida]